MGGCWRQRRHGAGEQGSRGGGGAYLCVALQASCYCGVMYKQHCQSILQLEVPVAFLVTGGLQYRHHGDQTRLKYAFESHQGATAVLRVLCVS